MQSNEAKEVSLSSSQACLLSSFSLSFESSWSWRLSHYDDEGEDDDDKDYDDKDDDDKDDDDSYDEDKDHDDDDDNHDDQPHAYEEGPPSRAPQVTHCPDRTEMSPPPRADEIQCGALPVQYGALRYTMVQFNIMQFSTVRWNVMPYNVVEW